MTAVHSMDQGEKFIPFLLQFYGHPSTHLWEDEEGTVHEIQQGEGGEQGDPLMIALFAMFQHQALQVVQESLQPTETLMAFLDDVCVLSNPDRISEVEGSMERELWDHARIQVNHGKTQVWNRSGVRPTHCDHLFFRADGQPNEVWRGDPTLPFHKQGVTRGTQLLWKPSSPRKLQTTTHLERIPQMQDLQCAWLLLCFALHQEQIASFVLFTLNRVSISRCVTTQESEGASNSCCTSQCPTKCGKWPLCSSLRFWVCGTPRDCVPRHTGPTGLTLSLWCGAVTQGLQTT